MDRFRFPAINSSSLASWVSAGLVVEAPPGDESGIIFQVEWGTKQLNHFLRTLLPTLFAHLGTLNQHVEHIKDEADDTGAKRIDYTWPYVLLHKDRKRYEPVDETHPSGQVYHDNLSGTGAHGSFRGKAIFLGMSPPPTPPLWSSQHDSYEGPNPARDPQSMVYPSSCPGHPTLCSHWEACQR